MCWEFDERASVTDSLSALQGSRQNKNRAMNKFCNLVILAVLALVALVGYWYLNPHKMPGFIRDNMPGAAAPSPRSPMTNFRPPQF
jgi:hypothetical protein